MRIAKLGFLPFVVGVVLSQVQGLIPIAHALECVGAETWFIMQVTTTGEPIPFPDSGSLSPDELDLWAEGYQFEIEYRP